MTDLIDDGSMFVHSLGWIQYICSYYITLTHTTPPHASSSAQSINQVDSIRCDADHIGCGSIPTETQQQEHNCIYYYTQPLPYTMLYLLPNDDVHVRTLTFTQRAKDWKGRLSGIERAIIAMAVFPLHPVPVTEWLVTSIFVVMVDMAWHGISFRTPYNIPFGRRTFHHPL